MEPHWATHFVLVPRSSLTPKPINSMCKQAAQEAINESETVCPTTTQSFWISQVFLSNTDLLKRVMTGIANPIAIGVAQHNQTNTVICQLSFFFELLTNGCIENLWVLRLYRSDPRRTKTKKSTIRESWEAAARSFILSYKSNTPLLRVLIPKKLTVS